MQQKVGALAMRLNKVKKAEPATMDKAFIQFINWKKANNLSEQTILDYTTHIKLFFKRLPNASETYEKLE
jgi:hypothetical protein